MPVILTTEQQTIINAVRAPEAENLIVQALAGAAKTTTLLEIAKAVRVPTLALAFNKRIADELSTRFPTHVECRTFNSVGHRALPLKGRINLNSRKMGEIFSTLTLEWSPADRKEVFNRMGDLTSSTGFAKNLGYVPNNPDISMIESAEFFNALEHSFEPAFVELIDVALLKSIELCSQNVVDFDDQLYYSVLFGGLFNRSPLVLVDEAQDLSPINLAMLRKVAGKRVVAVGDRFQSIYAFRGAMSNSMDILQNEFQMTEHKLTTTFRCAKAIVAEARIRAPEMKPRPNAPEGSVSSLVTWSVKDIEQSSAILCRNNGPLVRLAFALLRAGRSCNIVGSADIARQIDRVFTDIKKNKEDITRGIEVWKTKALKKTKNKRRIDDLEECLHYIHAEAGDSIEACLAHTRKLFEGEGTIKLMTGHKSKGFEFHTVYIYNRELIDISGGSAQEKNLLYVMRTRAKERLFYIDMPGCVEFVDPARREHIAYHVLYTQDG